MPSSSRSPLTREELDGRLNCFGEFEEADAICLKSCALSINCAIAKQQFLGFQRMDDSGVAFGFGRREAYEVE